MNINTMNWRDMSEHPEDGAMCYFEVIEQLQYPLYAGENGVWNAECQEFRGPKDTWIMRAKFVKRWTYCVEDAA